MSDGQIVPVALRRFDTSQPWGFKLQGGCDVGCPIHVAQVRHLTCVKENRRFSNVVVDKKR
jgi:hypothetical protein